VFHYNFGKRKLISTILLKIPEETFCVMIVKNSTSAEVCCYHTLGKLKIKNVAYFRVLHNALLLYFSIRKSQGNLQCTSIKVDMLCKLLAFWNKFHKVV